jgi:hypothetical protein
MITAARIVTFFIFVLFLVYYYDFRPFII